MGFIDAIGDRRKWDALLAWLDELEASMASEHKAALASVSLIAGRIGVGR
jgi:hypothetical protein